MQTPELEPGLYIVATPIGNLGDVSRRAIETLSGCAVVACEDTRVTGKLLHHLGIKRPLRRYDDHASDAAREALLGEMTRGAVALVSDAGTPLISDPGYRLVREARARGIAVTTIPGASALVAALTLAGLPTDRFLFAGFLPSKDKARGDVLAELAAVPATLVFYETGPRLVASLEAMARLLPGREIAVARELTKLHEECRTGTAVELAAHYTAHPPKGEIVLLAGPPGAAEKPGEADVDAELLAALADLPVSKAAALVAKKHGLDRKVLYARALELRG
ncbi:16S rRNA (cytidine(1402)-2'-O)-methyltransferase [Novosphingobium sp.]|uniref:16S rRNA (cytidine(1402)-2'-O)-methyltransferase n=1 Tax=Novosphingobium sp. TaxID=1874826 RepID=UPI001DA1464B|nr:16S rRNA (cytidine(1402)-2'-O)-methyltransferase [Novosphingobium sp.]MBX9665776.1 16S rRNA (cytidine(1402)-2'-O)-methyltransferase [Novosphingobium sp.]